MTLLFLLITGLYLYRTASIAIVFYKLNQAVSGGNSPDFTLLQYFPHFLTLPILFSLAAILFFYCALKIRDRSPLGWLLGLTILFAVPPALWLIGTNTVGATGLLQINSAYTDPTIIFAAIAIVSLLFRKKVYNQEGQPIKVMYRLILLIFFIFVSFPLLVYTMYAKYKILTNDYKYHNIRQDVEFEVLRPTHMPPGRVFESNYYISKQELIPHQKTVQFQLNYPLTDLLKGKKSGLLVVQQSVINKGSEYELFKSKEVATHEAKIVKVSRAINKEATIIDRKKELSLIFITPQQLLVRIRAYDVTSSELTKFADGLQ